MGAFVLDTDCSSGRGYTSLAIDLLSQNSPCYYNDSYSGSLNPTEQSTTNPSCAPIITIPTSSPITENSEDSARKTHVFFWVSLSIEFYILLFSFYY